MYANNMTKLLNKIERRLGTKLMNLPSDIGKDSWVEIICEDTLDTFSRFYPNKIRYTVDTSRDKNIKRGNGFYHIDEDIIPGDITVYGLRDIDFTSLYNANLTGTQNGSYLNPTYNDMYGYEDIVMAQMRANMNSAVNSGAYVIYEHPHMIAVQGTGYKDLTAGLSSFTVELFVKHADNLTTISPTKMETFEELAILDVKIFLYNSLKLFEEIETAFGIVKLRIDDWSGSLDERKTLVDYIKESYVSADNLNQPIMYVV